MFFRPPEYQTKRAVGKKISLGSRTLTDPSTRAPSRSTRPPVPPWAITRAADGVHLRDGAGDLRLTLVEVVCERASEHRSRDAAHDRRDGRRGAVSSRSTAVATSRVSAAAAAAAALGESDLRRLLTTSRLPTCRPPD